MELQFDILYVILKVSEFYECRINILNKLHLVIDGFKYMLSVFLNKIFQSTKFRIPFLHYRFFTFNRCQLSNVFYLSDFDIPFLQGFSNTRHSKQFEKSHKFTKVISLNY